MVFQWAIIGAGPAGIATIGRLLDQGVPPDQIAWIDPAFRVGDFGTQWRNVPSNTKAALFTRFLEASPAFNYKTCSEKFALQRVNPEQTCSLELMAEPLRWLTAELRKKVSSFVGLAEHIVLQNRVWNITLAETTLAARHVVLATGAQPKHLNFSSHAAVIPLQDAMDSQRLYQHCNKDQTIAVFGSSHSAILVLRNLVESRVKRIINFYRSPLRYAVYLDNWILFDNTGLKGSTADWARENIDGKLPANLERIYSSEENIEQHLALCDKAIYAVGFERRHLPVVEGITHIEYSEECGIIAPGLFGIGIAFPEGKYNKFGIYEHRVGLWKFMDYLERILPIWMKYSP